MNMYVIAGGRNVVANNDINAINVENANNSLNYLRDNLNLNLFR